MKNILKISIAAAASATLFAGCIKETFPTNSATQNQISSPTEFVNSLNTAMIRYNSAGMVTGYNAHFDFGLPSIHIVTEAMCEDFAFLGNGMDWFFWWGENRGLSEQYIYCDIAWSNYYSWIKMCNDAIKMIDPATEDEVLRETLGIAYFYRAYYYLDLVRLYEFKENIYTDGSKVLGLGVPIVTEETTEEEARNNPRAAVEDVFQLIFGDLQRSETLLKDYARTDKTMPDLSVIYGLYARAYLWRGDADDQNYAKAADYARKAIDASGCTPLTQDQWEDPINGFNSRTSNSWMLALAQSSDNVNNLVNFVAFMNCENTWGYGQNARYGLNRRLYLQINDKDFRKHSWVDPKGTGYYDYKTNRDKVFIDQLAQYFPYTSLKFRTAQGNVTNYTVGNATDYPLMRVEEMYLIEAEAAGKASVNAGIQKLNDFMKFRITDGSYNCSSKVTDFRSLQQEVALQKRIEFWGEGIAFYDFKRLRLGMTRGYTGTNVPDSYRLNATEIAPWWNWVIIISETRGNRALVNNPDPSDTIDLWE